MNQVLIVVALTIGAPAPKDKPPSVVGEWVVEQSIDSGRPDPAPEPVRWTFKPDGNWIIVNLDGKETGHGRYTTDPSKSPATLDFNLQDQTYPCIFKVEGDTLTVVLAPPPIGRPIAFASAAGSQHTLHVFKRAKKD